MKLKNALKGQRFAELSDIERNVKTLLRGIPENDFQDCFRQWHHRLTKCIASYGEYFEGDSSRQCTGKQILLSQGHSGIKLSHHVYSSLVDTQLPINDRLLECF